MKNNMREGYGVFYYPDGAVYRGYWLVNEMHGKGEFFYRNGKKAYEGDFF